MIQNTVNGYETDITDIVEDAKPSLVMLSQGSHKSSGVIIAVEKDTAAYIMTSSQGLQNDGNVEVKFENTMTVEGSVVGSDPETGLALVKVQPDFEVTAVKLGDSSLMKAGEVVTAIGGRRDNDSAMISSGTVSTLVQMPANPDAAWISNLLEADITVSDGNVGGAVLNLSGELLGIIIPHPSNGQMEMGYAVSMNEVKNVYNDLKASGTVTRGNLGVIGRGVDQMNSYEKNADSISLDLTSGVFVSSIKKDSAADGLLQEGDLITAVDNKTLLNVEELHTILYSHNPGDSISLSIERDGNEEQVAVTLK